MEPVSGMSAIITAITSLVTGIVGWMGQIFTFVMAEGHELALICFIIGFAGLAIHWFKLLTRG